jgi:hypothetical protein
MDEIRRTKVRMLRRFLEKIEQELRIVLSEEESSFKTDRAKKGWRMLNPAFETPSNEHGGPGHQEIA